MSSQLPISFERIEELLLPALFGAVGTYASYTTLDFPTSARVWPLMVSLVLVLGCGLILLENYLPSLLAALTEEERIIGSEQDIDDSLGEDTKEDSLGRLPVPPTVFTTLAIVGYALLGYLVGLLWATPIFVAGYLAQFERPRWLIVFLSVVSFALAFGFMEVLYLGIDSGILTPGVSFL